MPVPASQNLTDDQWTSADARRVFAVLEPPQESQLVGTWPGRLIGRPRLLRLGGAIATCTRLRGWCGKRITGDGRVIMLLRRHGRVVDGPVGDAGMEVSIIDDRPAFVVAYGARNRPPVRWVRTEVRWLVPGERLLGLMMLNSGRDIVLPIPFVLERASAPQELVIPLARAGDVDPSPAGGEQYPADAVRMNLGQDSAQLTVP